MKLFGTDCYNNGLVKELALLNITVTAVFHGFAEDGIEQEVYLCFPLTGRPFRVVVSELFDWGDVYVPENEWHRIPANIRQSFSNDRIFCATKGYHWIPNTKTW